MRYAIIGMGVAGIAAAEAIRSHDADGEIVMISDDPNGFYSRPGLAYYLTGEVEQKQLFPYPEAEFKKLNLKYVGGHVTHINAAEHTLSIAPDKFLPYDRLLIATGASATPIKTPGANLEGVVKLDHLDDAKHILQKAKKTRTAVVVGGGITALEIVEGLVSRRVKVHYLLRGDRYWGNVLDEKESRIVEYRLKEEGVQIHFNTELAEIIGNKGAVSSIRTTDGKQIKCEMVAGAIGIQPRIQLAQESGIQCDRGILTNEFMQTNMPDVFAAGDVAQVYDPESGKSIVDSLWSPAREEGFIAGLNMSGEKRAYVKHAPFNVTRLAGLTTTIIGSVGGGRDEDLIGIARGDSETWRDIPDAIIAQSGFEINRLRLMIGSNTILGAIVMGDQKLSTPLEILIREKIDITPIKDQLLSPNAKLADVLIKFWKAYSRS